jgi:hypothetical protein
LVWAQDAGVVVENVEPAEGLPYLLDELFDLGLAGDVGANGLRISSATALAPSMLMSEITTAAPAVDSRRAVAAPIPPAAPVTTATLSANEITRDPSLDLLYYLNRDDNSGRLNRGG